MKNTRQHPNLLFIFTDEQRFDTLARSGGDPNLMPRLNRWAEKTTLFEQTYCTQPVCTPSRGSILTGLYPRTHGATRNNVHLHKHSRCLPEMLERGSYQCAYMGKWHLGDEIYAQHGFPLWLSTEDTYHDYYSQPWDGLARSSYSNWLGSKGFMPTWKNIFFRSRLACLPEPFSRCAYLAQNATHFLREQANNSNPFCLYINFLEPHMPFYGPRTHQFEPDQSELPSPFQPPQPQAHLKARLKAQSYLQNGFDWYNLTTEQGWLRMISGYRGLCRLVDDYVGDILDELERSDQAEHTIVVFTSDHGDMMGCHRLLGKEVMYQPSVRVPCLIKLPGQTTPSTISGPFSQIDLVPTLLDAMGQELPEHLHGQSRFDLLATGKDHKLEEDVLIVWNGLPSDQRKLPEDTKPWQLDLTQGNPQLLSTAEEETIHTIITADGWRYSHSYELEQHELHNLNTDPLECDNLAAHPHFTPQAQTLRQKAQTMARKVGELVCI